MYRYLIVPNDNLTPFYTNWCDAEKFPMSGGIAFDLVNMTESRDGETWTETEQDHL